MNCTLCSDRPGEPGTGCWRLLTNPRSTFWLVKGWGNMIVFGRDAGACFGLFCWLCFVCVVLLLLICLFCHSVWPSFWQMLVCFSPSYGFFLHSMICLSVCVHGYASMRVRGLGGAGGLHNHQIFLYLLHIDPLRSHHHHHHLLLLLLLPLLLNFLRRLDLLCSHFVTVISCHH